MLLLGRAEGGKKGKDMTAHLTECFKNASFVSQQPVHSLQLLTHLAAQHHQLLSSKSKSPRVPVFPPALNSALRRAGKALKPAANRFGMGDLSNNVKITQPMTHFICFFTVPDPLNTYRQLKNTFLGGWVGFLFGWFGFGVGFLPAEAAISFSSENTCNSTYTLKYREPSAVEIAVLMKSVTLGS